MTCQIYLETSMLHESYIDRCTNILELVMVLSIDLQVQLV